MKKIVNHEVSAKHPRKEAGRESESAKQQGREVQKFLIYNHENRITRFVQGRQQISHKI